MKVLQFPTISLSGTQRSKLIEREKAAAVQDGTCLAFPAEGRRSSPFPLTGPVSAGPVSRGRSGSPYWRSGVATRTATPSTDRSSVNALASPAWGRVNGSTEQHSATGPSHEWTQAGSTSGDVPTGWRVVRGGRSGTITKPTAVSVGGGRSAPHLHIVTAGVNDANKDGGEESDDEGMQRERQEIAVLERLEEAQSRLRHGDKTGMRVLNEAITDLDRLVQERVLIERAQRLGLNAPTVVRGFSEYRKQMQRNGERIDV